MTLPEDQQVVLQAIYGEFKATAKWPTFQHLDIVLDQEHGIAVEPVLMALRDAVLVRVYTPIRPQSEVALRIAGLAHCDGSENDLVLFGRLLQWSVEKERRFRPSSPHEVEQQIVTSDEAAAEWREAGEEVSDLDLQKAYELVAVEMLYEGHGSNATTWQLNMSPRIRRFRGVRNYNDYLRVIADDEQVQAAANQLVSPSPDLSVVQPRQQVRVVGRAAPEPEGPSLSVDSLHPLVCDAVRPLFAIKHYAEGVEKAVRVLRDVVRDKSGFTKDDGDILMGKALGGKTPPIVVADLAGETGKNIQRGTMLLAQGIVARMRNPLTHETVDLELLEALEMVAVISRVLRDLDGGSMTPIEDAVDAPS
jgi:uncharacterized protein (TIGR02391 family)